MKKIILLGAIILSFIAKAEFHIGYFEDRPSRYSGEGKTYLEVEQMYLNEVKKGDVLFTTSSETPEEVGMSSVWAFDINNVYLNSFCFGYRLNKQIDLNYLAYCLRSDYIRSQMILLAQGISRYNISKKGVMEIEILIPTSEEQTVIGNFFRQLDETIALQSAEVEKLNQLKKGLLAAMLV